MEYITITHHVTRELDMMVTKKLAEGYKLYGSPYAMGGNLHCQGMAKGDYRNKPKKK